MVIQCKPLKIWDLDGTLVTPIQTNKEESISQVEYANRTKKAEIYPSMSQIFKNSLDGADNMIITGRKKSLQLDNTLYHLSKITEMKTYYSTIKYDGQAFEGYDALSCQKADKQLTEIEVHFFPEDLNYDQYVNWKVKLIKDLVEFQHDYCMQEMLDFQKVELYEDDLEIISKLKGIKNLKINICKDGNILGVI